MWKWCLFRCQLWLWLPIHSHNMTECLTIFHNLKRPHHNLMVNKVVKPKTILQFGDGRGCCVPSISGGSGCLSGSTPFLGWLETANVTPQCVLSENVYIILHIEHSWKWMTIMNHQSFEYPLFRQTHVDGDPFALVGVARSSLHQESNAVLRKYATAGYRNMLTNRIFIALIPTWSLPDKRWMVKNCGASRSDSFQCWWCFYMFICEVLYMYRSVPLTHIPCVSFKH